MSVSEDMKNIVEDIVSSYESRIQNMSSVFDTACQLIGGFQDSSLDARQERQEIKVQIREILAENEHLRKRDFDNMMQDILSIQDERKKDIRDLLNGYLNEQREKANALRENLEKFRNSLAESEGQRVNEFRAFMQEIFAGQEKRKEEVISSLKEFQREQRETAERLRELLDKGKNLRIKDLKSVLKEFKILHYERSASREERKRKVRAMRDDVRREKIEAAMALKTCRGG